MTVATNAVRNRRAYSVHDGDEGWAIVFAHRAASARSLGANELDCEKDEVEVERIRWADQYYPDVPMLARLEHGWWTECCGCGIRIDGGFAEDPVTGDEIELDPVEDNRGVFCTAACRDSYDQGIRERGVAEHLALAALADVLRARFPGVELVGRPHAYVQRDSKTREWVTHQAVLHFEFPGWKIAPASFRFNNPGETPAVYVCAGDKDAWDAWRAAEGAQPEASA